MMQLTELAELLGAELLGDNASFTGVSTDTRKLLPGELFIALEGAMYNGHEFIAVAAEKQAAAALISHPVDRLLPLIQVQDTRLALGQMAAYHRNRFTVPVIAVTGSCGKTTTKAMMASILSCMGAALAPESSFNNDIGVPLTLLKFQQLHRYAVIEMGANHPGEIAYLCELAKPDVAVVTNVAPAHLAGFGSIAGVAEAKGEIYQGLSLHGIAIINQDESFATSWLSLINSRRVISFGINAKADFTAVNITLDEEGRPRFLLIYPEGEVSIQLPVLGMHNVSNALAAAAATYAVGASGAAIEQGLATFSPVSKRLIKHLGRSGAQVIDDTYNANPKSVLAALEVLACSSLTEKIFVFGGMGELGLEEEKFHTEIGHLARKMGIQRLFGYGRLSQLTVQAFGENGFHFMDQNALVLILKNILSPKTIVLVKGSRLACMENVVQALI
jgi:UDP-N-acetylmuramoyl-tripeptide--D-alanyl-D-alanine ligase